jgi:hypothetical protein
MRHPLPSPPFARSRAEALALHETHPHLVRPARGHDPDLEALLADRTPARPLPPALARQLAATLASDPVKWGKLLIAIGTAARKDEAQR